ncbi:MAG: hypothetical protein ACFCBW_10820, partial [Candidatus Competibacterales bacterium]
RLCDTASHGPCVTPSIIVMQFLRDNLESVGWDNRPPGPVLPEAIVRQTAARYREALARLRGAGQGEAAAIKTCD